MKQGRVIINMKYYTTSSTGEIGFYSFFFTAYIGNFYGSNRWKLVNFVLTLVSDTDKIITNMRHATTL